MSRANGGVPFHQVASTIDNFRSTHISELNELATGTGASIGYGFQSTKPKPAMDDNIEGTDTAAAWDAEVTPA